MKLIRVGKVGRPHGFKGSFVVQEHSGQQSVLGEADHLWVGESPETAERFPIEEARWANQGWLVKVAGADSEDWVRAHVHRSIYLDRETFPKAEEGEFYVSDLVGFEAIDAESGEVIGTFLGSESLAAGMGPDRWWFKVGAREVAVPAIAQYIEAVDTKARSIRVRGLKEMP
jgi:16S rRNA processing protein RimM